MNITLEIAKRFPYFKELNDSEPLTYGSYIEALLKLKIKDSTIAFEYEVHMAAQISEIIQQYKRKKNYILFQSITIQEHIPENFDESDENLLRYIKSIAHYSTMREYGMFTLFLTKGQESNVTVTLNVLQILSEEFSLVYNFIRSSFTTSIINRISETLPNLIIKISEGQLYLPTPQRFPFLFDPTTPKIIGDVPKILASLSQNSWEQYIDILYVFDRFKNFHISNDNGLLILMILSKLYNLDKNFVFRESFSNEKGKPCKTCVQIDSQYWSCKTAVDNFHHINEKVFDFCGGLRDKIMKRQIEMSKESRDIALKLFARFPSWDYYLPSPFPRKKLIWPRYHWLVELIACGLSESGKPDIWKTKSTSSWVTFLRFGLYDPRLFLHIFVFFWDPTQLSTPQI